MKQAESLVRQGERTVLGLAATHRRCWEAACKHDDIDPESLFVCFSPQNPYVPFLTIIFQQYLEAQEALRAWGYVGLSITQRAPGPKRHEPDRAARGAALKHT